MIVGVDYRPALFRAFGIGRYVKNLCRELPEADPKLELRLLAVFLRGLGRRVAEHGVPAGPRVRFRGLAFPARLFPSVRRLGVHAERLLGPLDLFHDTDYAATPVARTRRIVTLYDTAYLPKHGFVSPEQATKMLRLVEGLLRGRPHVIAISEFAKDEVAREFSLDRSRIHVTPLGADPIFADPATDALLPEILARFRMASPYVACIGTLEPRKNTAFLVRAFADARRRERRLRLVLLGRPGWRHEDADAAAKEEGVAGAVVRMGSLADAETAAVVRGAACLAFPTLYEGFGLPAIEGLAAGTPVVASDLPVLKESCGLAARYVAPSDRAGWADALLEAAAVAVDASSRAAGRAQAARFTWRACAEKTAAAYRAAIAEDAP